MCVRIEAIIFIIGIYMVKQTKCMVASEGNLSQKVGLFPFLAFCIWG
jgi:hypothetical protein